jgi:hypothetical protein
MFAIGAGAVAAAVVVAAAQRPINGPKEPKSVGPANAPDTAHARARHYSLAIKPKPSNLAWPPAPGQGQRGGGGVNDGQQEEEAAGAEGPATKNTFITRLVLKLYTRYLAGPAAAGVAGEETGADSHINDPSQCESLEDTLRHGGLALPPGDEPGFSTRNSAIARDEAARNRGYRSSSRATPARCRARPPLATLLGRAYLPRKGPSYEDNLEPSRCGRPNRPVGSARSTAPSSHTRVRLSLTRCPPSSRTSARPISFAAMFASITQRTLSRRRRDASCANATAHIYGAAMAQH